MYYYVFVRYTDIWWISFRIVKLSGCIVKCVPLVIIKNFNKIKYKNYKSTRTHRDIVGAMMDQVKTLTPPNDERGGLWRGR